VTHQLTLEIPDEVYQPLLQKAREQGQSVETVAQECVAEAVRQTAPGNVHSRWIGAFQSELPDAAERHHEYLGQALHDEMPGRTGE